MLLVAHCLQWVYGSKDSKWIDKMVLGVYNYGEQSGEICRLEKIVFVRKKTYYFLLNGPNVLVLIPCVFTDLLAVVFIDLLTCVKESFVCCMTRLLGLDNPPVSKFQPL